MKYVFVIPDIDFLYFQYRDFELLNNGKLVRINNKFRRFAKFFCKIGLHKTKVLNPIFNYGLKKSFLQANVDFLDENCFILYSRTYEDFRGIITSYIRKKFQQPKIIVYYGDLISRHLCDIDEVKSNADLVYSFDEKDAANNDIKWLIEPFSSSISEMSEFLQETNKIEWDVTFVGHAKKRYEKIIKMYEVLTSNGLKCDFHITGVPKEKQKYQDQIKYEALSFTELLRHVVKSKCIAEVMQDNGVSPTTRYTEAMIFKKNLLTDCKYFEIAQKRSENVIYVKDIMDIGKKEIADIQDKKDFDRSDYLRLFSISNMISTISKEIK